MQETFDTLYESSRKNVSFTQLMDLVQSKNNILLAYRTIKKNKGAKTSGTDRRTILHLQQLSEDSLVQLVQQEMDKYKPRAVRRVYIPKANGKTRPLGIPTILDRLIQQAVKQIIEPICEAKFYAHSYGFRPLRSTKHALARTAFLVNKVHYHYAVDVDIKGFFDHVNHRLLIKQLWNIGIQDRQLLKIISKMLKAPIQGIGIPTCGTPQGGILSPLLANVVLNDLDWWVANQWEHIPTQKRYASNGIKRTSLRSKTNLKEGFIVRYADDFKVLTKDYQMARKWFYGVKGYLKDRLKLDISMEKSKIVNLRKKKSEFLGFTIRAIPKRNKRVCMTGLSEKKKHEIKKEAKRLIKTLQKSPNARNAMRYNSYILGIHNYFRVATNVHPELSELDFQLSKYLYNRMRLISKRGYPTRAAPIYKKFYRLTYKTYRIAGVYLFPLKDIQMKILMSFSQKLNLFTPNGRDLLEHKNLTNMVNSQIKVMLKHAKGMRSTEYYDNRISRYSMVRGRCEILGVFLYAHEMHCHHLKPVHLKGTDEYDNLRIIHQWVHQLVHSTENQTIRKYIKLLRPTEQQMKKINQYRKKCNLIELEV